MAPPCIPLMCKSSVKERPYWFSLWAETPGINLTNSARPSIILRSRSCELIESTDPITSLATVGILEEMTISSSSTLSKWTSSAEITVKANSKKQEKTLYILDI